MEKELKNDYIDEFHYHEIMDRLYIIETMVDNYLLEHPVLNEDKDLKKIITNISNDLHIAYQISSISSVNINIDKKKRLLNRKYEIK